MTFRSNRSQKGETPAVMKPSESFITVMERRLSRRRLLQGAAMASAAAVVASVAGRVELAEAVDTPGGSLISAKLAVLHPVLQTKSEVGFLPVSDDAPKVAAGYKVETLLRWGDPILKGAPDFDPPSRRPKRSNNNLAITAILLALCRCRNTAPQLPATPC